MLTIPEITPGVQTQEGEDVNYSVKAHPTEYNSRRYRSRLEAKWAAFFDLVGWRHEYEPLDLGEWSPDFAILSDSGEIAALVEVKPIGAFHEGTASKMERGVKEHSLQPDPDANVFYCAYPLLLLGVAPAPTKDRVAPYASPYLGWLGEPILHASENESTHFWARAPLAQDERGRLDFAHEFGLYSGRVRNRSHKELFGVASELISGLWSAAANKVQWQKR